MFKNILVLATSLIFIACGGSGSTDEEPNIIKL